MRRAFHVQYGLSRHVGRFLADGEGYPPGHAVVVRTARGDELGRVVAEAGEGAGVGSIVRAAGPDDLERARHVASERHRRFADCLRVFDDGVWPIQPIDVEPLLDEGRAVLHYLGPHRLDVDGLRAALKAASGLDLVFEPVGRDAPEDDPAIEPRPEADDHGCGSCGSDGGCGSGGGCGTTSGGGCSGCSVATLVSSRRSAPASV